MESNDPDIIDANAKDTSADESSKESGAMVDHQDLSAWRGKDILDCHGERIGVLEDVYFDIETDQPQFGTVKVGFLDRHFTFVPLTTVTIGPEYLQVPVTKQLVKDAPAMEHEGEALTQADEALLYHHYEMNYTPSANPSGRRLARH